MPRPTFVPPPPLVTIPADAAAALEQAILDVLLNWLRPYQADWLEDRARYKIGVWLRQHGKTEVISLESVLQGLEPAKAPEQVELIVSAGDEQAMEVLRKATRWANLFDEACKRATGLSIFTEPPTMHSIPLLTGVRVKSLSSNPLTLAGYTGEVHWDEASKTRRDKDVLEAVGAIIQSNPAFRFRMTGTYWGDTGVFYDNIHAKPGYDYQKAKADRLANPTTFDPRKYRGWSRHRVTARDIMALGIRDQDWWDEINAMYDPLTVQQDYLCNPVSGLTSVFSRDLLTAAMDKTDELAITAPLPHPAEWAARGLRIGLGIDIGRTHDLTAAVWAVEWPEGTFRIYRAKGERGMKFPDQEKWLASCIRDGVSRCRVDATGMGRQMGETLADMFPGIVDPMTFTQGLKQDWTTLLLKLMESGLLGLPNSGNAHNDLISDFTSVRRKILPGGGISYDTERTEKGHGDFYWAACLAVSALATASSWRMAFESDGILTVPDDTVKGGLRIIDRLPEGGLPGTGPRERRKVLPTAADLGVTGGDEDDLFAGADEDERALMEELGVIL